MAKIMHSVLTFLLLLNFSVSNASVTSSLCSKAPFPELCNSLVPTDTLSTLQNIQSNIRNLALRATMNEAQRVHKIASTMDLSRFDVRASTAWADCMELFEATLTELDRCLNSSTYSSDDVQTWLSAAIANHETCQNGFKELNLESYLSSSPFVSFNVSKFIRNSLYINKVASSVSSSLLGKIGGRRLLSHGFPSWVSATDRKLLQVSTVKADVIVAKDGSGNYKTISEAVSASAKFLTGRRFVIHIKAGVYNENVEITKKMKNLMFIGDGIEATIVRGSKYKVNGIDNTNSITTFRTATVAVNGDGFIAREITFENTAGPQKDQAVALRSSADLSVFYKCSFKGYQDTLYVHSLRQFYRECDIYGTVDFIFGDAVAVLQNCNIYVRRPRDNQKNTITAQGRTDANENTGISIHNSRVTAASDLKPVQSSFQSYLGRPWKQYSRTVFMKTSIDSLIDPAGWLEWSGNFALSTLYYGEYMNTGPGSATGERVKWDGYRVITSASEAEKFTVGSFLSGNSWIPATGVPFTAGL